MRGHTGGAMTMGRGYPLDTSTKHKLISRNSTESEIIAVDRQSDPTDTLDETFYESPGNRGEGQYPISG